MRDQISNPFNAILSPDLQNSICSLPVQYVVSWALLFLRDSIKYFFYHVIFFCRSEGSLWQKEEKLSHMDWEKFH
jgi:hypothetical protein